MENILKNDQETLMCSDEEARQRIQANVIHLFELAPGTDISRGKVKAHRPWLVKKYVRNCENDSIRDPETLDKTLDYLFNNILFLETNGNPMNYSLPRGKIVHTYEEIYDFLSDRLRAIAKDYKILGENTSDLYIKNHERMAKFYIMSSSRACYYEGFDIFLNDERCRDILSSLIEGYKERRKLNIHSENEAEFVAYKILIDMDKPIEVVTILKEISRDLLNREILQLAVNIFFAYWEDNYSAFFRLVKNSSYWISCACYKFFESVRVSAMEIMKIAFREIYLDEFIDALWFSSTEEACEFLNIKGIRIKWNENKAEVCMKGIGILQNSYKPKIAISNIENKRFIENCSL
ncbi:unnamed protein product [Blepharisma stoltei]|uniref:SAC3/GANP/THP3 conserved domain-containing protein n=1 Tax=Blepharisma stoltei TaxID=1481888 RepID=A0AAU9IMA1_9CILI|nr:unnamed protein product [Blepharisma stoltei]